MVNVFLLRANAKKNMRILFEQNFVYPFYEARTEYYAGKVNNKFQQCLLSKR